MIQPELREIVSPELEPPAVPADPRDCAVSFRVRIGPAGREEEEAFTFTVVTPRHLSYASEGMWGRGFLIVEVFSWDAVAHAFARLLAACARPTWPECVRELEKRLPAVEG